MKVFDAAEVLRLGKDLIVQQSVTTNRKGIDWLRRHTKSRGYRVHEIHFPDDLYPVHIGNYFIMRNLTRQKCLFYGLSCALVKTKTIAASTFVKVCD